MCVCKAHKKNAAFTLIEIDRILLQHPGHEYSKGLSANNSLVGVVLNKMACKSLK